MTCREKLKQEHPDKIDPKNAWGGCEGCPKDYNYLTDPDFCTDDSISDPDVRCGKCWDREIPEKKYDLLTELCNLYGISRGEAEKAVDMFNADMEKLVNVVDSIPECYTDGTEKIVDGRGKRATMGIIDEACDALKWEHKGEPIAKAKSEIDENGDLSITLLPYKPGALAYGKVVPDEVQTIKDSGNRREFETGAVRDIQEGKGRCDLLPLDILSNYIKLPIFGHLESFKSNPTNTWYLFECLHLFSSSYEEPEKRARDATMFLEVSKHFEEGAKKYGEYNWQKGIPTHCYIDSAVRHYLKYLRGDKDEPHDRAFVWNILCCIWTCIHKPELNDYKPVVEKKKRSKREIMERRAQLNEERKKRLGTNG